MIPAVDMSKPQFVEDSNHEALAPLLASTVNLLGNNPDKFDLIVCFFIALMVEKEYRLSCLYDPQSNIWDDNMTCIPRDWKRDNSNIYDLLFRLHKCPDVGCRLICVPVGDWMVLNLLPSPKRDGLQTRCMTVNVTKHVNVHLQELGWFWHLKQLAITFKNNLLNPIHSGMLMQAGCPSPCLQGLPGLAAAELHRRLDSQSRTNLEKAMNTSG